MTRDWEPILDGSDAADALEQVAAIGQDLRAAHDFGPPDLQGAAGRSLLFAYLGVEDPASEGDAVAALEAAVVGVTTHAQSLGLWEGCAGVRWVLSHLSDPAETGTAIDTLDRVIADALQDSPWQGPLDLYRGLAGLAVAYAGEEPRIRYPMVRAILDRFDEQGVATATMGAGVAHGAAGLICALAYHAVDGPDAPRARGIIDGLVDWMFTHRERVATQRPGWAGASLGWCHGDLGIALGLLAAARLTGRPGLERVAIDAAMSGATLAEVPTMDTSLCHGAAGIAHLSNRMYQATSNDELASRARSWLRRTLAQARPGTGIGGYLMCRRKGPASSWWRADPSVLVGSAGVGLALLAGASAQEPAWDRLLAADVVIATATTEVASGACV